MALITGLDHIQIEAPADCEVAARAFFGDFLDLPELDKPPVLAARGGVWFSLPDGRQLHIGVTGDFVPRQKGHPALRCGDLNAFVQRAAKFQVSVKADFELAPLRRVFLQDPWGNRLEVIEA
ncbi:VOC family protein [Deinococcus rubellus]|uniref:Glyoxalase n=1 Tax=Deinococcus rubellus TaxID=1889240 RepID=A0ABY5YES1_9DEIO|nr:glyoxalase [Deinococcus rubellus]UWX63340.1 glyoxalase [Deinococcus rubellus]